MAYATTLLVSEASLTSGNGSKSAYTEIIASTAAQYDGLLIQLHCATAGARVLADIATGAAASESVVIANLMFRGATAAQQATYFVPLRVAASTRLAFRAQGSAAVAVKVTVYGVVGAFTSYSTCTTYGADTTNTTGTFVDGGATPDTEGAWVELSASCGADHDQIIAALMGPNASGTTNTDVKVDIGTGAAASETAIINDLYVRNLNGGSSPLVGPLALYPASTIASGTRIAARCQADGTDASNRTAAVILYAMSSPFSTAANRGTRVKSALVG